MGIDYVSDVAGGEFLRLGWAEWQHDDLNLPLQSRWGFYGTDKDTIFPSYSNVEKIAY